MNLVVLNGLKEIDETIHIIRESIKYVRGSQVRKHKFLEYVNLLSVSSKNRLKQDVPTRWNSACCMLESAFFYHCASCDLELTHIIPVVHL